MRRTPPPIHLRHPLWIIIVSVTICIGSGATFGRETPYDDTMFEAPVFLKVGEQPMNEDGAMAYPSPAVFDIDNDGSNELVIGTIFGGVYICENENDGAGDPVWSAPTSAKLKDGEIIAMENW